MKLWPSSSPEPSLHIYLTDDCQAGINGCRLFEERQHRLALRLAAEMGRFTKPDLLLDQPEQILRILGNNSVITAHLNVDRTCVGKAYRFCRLLKCAGCEPAARLRVQFKVQAQLL